MPICGKKGIIGSFISQDHLSDGFTARTGATNIVSDFVRWASAHLILYFLMSSSPVMSPNTLGSFHAGIPVIGVDFEPGRSSSILWPSPYSH